MDPAKQDNVLPLTGKMTHTEGIVDKWLQSKRSVMTKDPALQKVIGNPMFRSMLVEFLDYLAQPDNTNLLNQLRSVLQNNQRIIKNTPTMQPLNPTTAQNAGSGLKPKSPPGTKRPSTLTEQNPPESITDEICPCTLSPLDPVQTNAPECEPELPGEMVNKTVLIEKGLSPKSPKVIIETQDFVLASKKAKKCKCGKNAEPGKDKCKQCLRDKMTSIEYEKFEQ